MASSIAVAFVAFLHLLFMILEMFFWTKPLGRRIFGLKPELAKQTAALAANQGLYNGFLAAGLIWGLASPGNATAISVFFLFCRSLSLYFLICPGSFPRSGFTSSPHPHPPTPRPPPPPPRHPHGL
jgi:putative membrane protein